MTCEERNELWELYALGVLDADEKIELDAHLAQGCETCGTNLRDALAVNSLMLSSVPQVAPPARLKQRVLAGAGVKPSTGWGWIATLAAACMLLVALWLSVQERHRSTELADSRRQLLQLAAERDRLQQALSFLDQPETEQVVFGKGQPRPPRGNVFLNSKLGVLLIASNLPKLDPGKTFEFWVIPKGGAPRPAGLFQAAGDGSAVHVLSGPIDTASLGAVAISVEPEAGSPAPTTTPIVVAGTPGL